MSQIINRKELSSLVFNRLNKTVPKRLIYDILNIIVDDMSDKLVGGESISIDNFGTFSTYLHSGHDAMNVVSNVVEYVPARRNIRLIAHATLDGLIQNRIKKFKT